MFGLIKGFGQRNPVAARLLVAWVGHAPALWLFYREILPRYLVVANAVAILLTATAVAGALVSGWFARPVETALAVWILCHVMWGGYLVWNLRHR
jgi:hypothetical protein